MRKVLLFVLFVASSYLARGQEVPDCEDPNLIIVTDCGTGIDLCIDRYTMSSGDIEMELDITSNDMGLIDPDLCYICGYCSHGELEEMDGFKIMYTPDPGFVGFDTFYYAVVIYDTCMIEDYCAPGDGKIWAIQSIFTGPDNSRIEVYSKHANGWDLVDEVESIDNGDYFWIDGHHLRVSQANWTFKIFLPGQSEPHSVVVHTSCSQDVLGKDFGYFRTITGCIATQQDKDNCDMTEPVRGDIDTRSSYMVTTMFEDETMVIIEVLNVLAIDFTDFKVSADMANNRISWNIDKVTNEESVNLEKSYDGNNFFVLQTYSDVQSGYYEYSDPLESGIERYFYRLVITDIDGIVSYSKIISISSSVYDKIVSIYPNPVISSIQIDVDDPDLSIVEYEIWDTNGKLITRTFTNKSRNINLTTDNLMSNNGLYLINIILDNGLNISKKVVVLGPS